MKKLLVALVGTVLILGGIGQAMAEDSGVLLGSDDGFTKHILKTSPDGTMLIEVSNVAFQGPQGDKGDTGDTGPIGPEGPQGIQGET